jgi:hypothetical protein
MVPQRRSSHYPGYCRGSSAIVGVGADVAGMYGVRGAAAQIGRSGFEKYGFLLHADFAVGHAPSPAPERASPIPAHGL